MINELAINLKLDQIIMLNQAKNRLEALKILESKWIWSEVANRWFLKIEEDEA